MKLWLITEILENCLPVWEDVNKYADSDYAERIREDYAEQLSEAGLLEEFSTAMQTVYRRTELGELLLTISHKKAFNSQMNLGNVLEILNNWDSLWEEYENEDESQGKEVGTLMVKFNQ